MQLYPAIDIKGGQCVRLTQGLFDNVKVYSDTPADMARMWRDQGATFLHLVDLDGALAGRSVNEAVIRSIVEAVDIPVEIGGGIRTAEAVRNMLDLGVARVIIGTKAVERPEFMLSLIHIWGGSPLLFCRIRPGMRFFICRWRRWKRFGSGWRMGGVRALPTTRWTSGSASEGAGICLSLIHI